MSTRTITREVFLEAPPATCIWGTSYYVDLSTRELIGEGQYLQRSDTVECNAELRSEDNGATWSEPIITPRGQRTPNGVSRKMVYPGYLCPHTNRLVRFSCEANLPQDSPHPAEAGRLWRTYYSVSEDGGHTTTHQGMVQQVGTEYSADHPLPTIWHGKNCVYRGALTCDPIAWNKDTFLMPLQCTLLDEHQELYSPTSGYGWFATLIIAGTWQENGDIAWKQLAQIEGDPSYTTRGLLEGAIGRLDEERLMLVMRGSNDSAGALSGHKWRCISSDGGQTWSQPEPWTFGDGSSWHSPSSCSQFIHHSNGDLLWIGNICPNNPKGNGPRYPLVVGKVDKASGLLDRHSISVIDTKADGDHESLQLSNFYAREDRANGDLIVHCSRLAHASPQGWQSDALIYRVPL